MGTQHAVANDAHAHNPTDVLRATALFGALKKDVLRALAARAQMKHHPKGRVLFTQEDNAQFFYVVADGWVKLFRETLDGVEAIVDVITTSHTFGETALFDDGKYPYSAEAVEDTWLLAVPTLALKELVESDSAFALHMLGAMARFRRQQDSELEHRTVQNAPQCVGCFLLRLCPLDARSPVTLHLPYDKTLLAARLGMQPETFSRALARLREDNLVHIRGATVEIADLKKLEEHVCNACSNSYPCADLC